MTQDFKNGLIAGMAMNNCLVLGGGGNVNYSLEEQIIGTWMGKPLYQRIVVIDALPSTTAIKDYPHNIPDIDQIAFTIGTAKWKNDVGTTSPLNTMQLTGTSANASASFFYLVNRTNIRIDAGMNRSSLSAEVIVAYTKTTD